MKQCPVSIKGASVRQRSARDRWEDDGCVSKDHREDKSQEDGVKHGVVMKCLPLGIQEETIGPHPQSGGDSQPEVTAQQMDGDEPGQSGQVNCSPGNVITEKP